MCNPKALEFGYYQLKTEILGKDVLEIGSRNVNGSLRSFLEDFSSTWTGIDLLPGKGVDFIGNAEQLLETFGSSCFDVVISTEMMEHVKDWKLVVSNMKQVVRPNGLILLTTCSKGHPFHEFPHDYWRYETTDIKKIFSDCDILALEKELRSTAVCALIRKPLDFQEKDLSNHKLYCIFTGRKETIIQKMTGFRKLYMLLRYTYLIKLRQKTAIN